MRDAQLNQYQERYVAFIDILGFSALVKKSNSSPELLTRIISILEEVQMYASIGQAMDASAANGPGTFFQDMFKMSTFSDSILLSTKVNLIGLGLITTISGIICNRLLHQGVFTRGAISKGNMIHTNQIAVGDGLIKAYKIESTSAIYPRIILDDVLIGDFQALEMQGRIPPLRRMDFDGLWHLHILEPKMLEMNSNTSKSEHAILNNEYMSLGRQEIENSLREATDMGVKAKVTWLARYFNEYAGSFGLQTVPLN
jgi:hypothetical protein